jgi:hypothetical protein
VPGSPLSALGHSRRFGRPRACLLSPMSGHFILFEGSQSARQSPDARRWKPFELVAERTCLGTRTAAGA